jgi:hypothetical protein
MTRNSGEVQRIKRKRQKKEKQNMKTMLIVGVVIDS